MKKNFFTLIFLLSTSSMVTIQSCTKECGDSLIDLFVEVGSAFGEVITLQGPFKIRCVIAQTGETLKTCLGEEGKSPATTGEMRIGYAPDICASHDGYKMIYVGDILIESIPFSQAQVDEFNVWDYVQRKSGFYMVEIEVNGNENSFDESNYDNNKSHTLIEVR